MVAQEENKTSARLEDKSLEDSEDEELFVDGGGRCQETLVNTILRETC